MIEEVRGENTAGYYSKAWTQDCRTTIPPGTRRPRYPLGQAPVRVEAAVMSVCEFELVARPSVTLDADLVAFGLSAQVTVHNRDCMAF